VMASLVSLSSCNTKKAVDSSDYVKKEAPESVLELVFTYGSEKEKWIKEVTATFNQAEYKTSTGKPIFVTEIPMGSGECVDHLLEEKTKAHLTSPASAAFIKLGNAKSRIKTGKDLIGETDNLVLSPVVIAMWKPMAEALGWGKKQLGWKDILAMANSPQGWGAYGYPQWGKFKFGHTHPEYSNSGLISLFAEVYAAAGKTAGLTKEDVKTKETSRFLKQIENSVVHYGSSTGFFGRKMFANGPGYLSAAVLYENMVIESYSNQGLPFPVVAIYPKEGTFWSDHPVGIVDREWVTPIHQEAAKIYVKYLLDRQQQEKAMNYGFRPGLPELKLTAPLDTNHGVDPQEPKTTLEVPSVDVMDAILASWKVNKKHSQIVLVLDTSGSMKGEKISNTKTGAKRFIANLSDEDTLSILSFSDNPLWVMRSTPLRKGRAVALQTIDSFIAEGKTRLYDSVDLAYQEILQEDKITGIKAVVVLGDGKDNLSRLSLDEFLKKNQFDSESRTIRIFTIGYGDEADKTALESMANRSQGKYFDGKPENIEDVFKEISTFF